MRLVRRLVVYVLVPLWVASGSPARAQAPASADAGESIDDPKLARRLGTRIDLPPPSAGPEGVAPPEASVPAEALSQAPSEASPASPASPAPWDGALTPEAPPVGDGGVAVPEAPSPRTARLLVSYRRFTFAQVGATSMSGPAAGEPFDVLSLDLYPISSSWRFGFSTQYGWQEGTFRQGGDAFIAEAVSLGGQIPGPVFTPFFEAYGGGGYMQRTHADLNSVATAYGQLGVDVGSQIFFAPHFCLSAAVGFLRATNGFVKDAVFGSFSVDALTFKLGLGL